VSARLHLWVAALAVLPSLAAAAPTPAGGACVADAECAIGTICDHGFCTPVRAQRRIIPPFYFERKGVEGYRHVIPLWFNNWNRAVDTKVLFPIFVQTTDKAAGSTLTVIPPILFGHKSFRGGGELTTLMPFFYWKHDGPQKWFVAPLFGSGGQRNEKEDLTEAVIGLVGYYRRHHDDTWRVLFPLYFDHETNDSRTTLLPLVWYRRTPGHVAGVGFPLFWHLRDDAAGRQHTLLLPLFDYESENHGRRLRVISPLGGYERDDDAGLKQLLLLAPSVFYRRDPQRTVTVVPPLVTAWHVHDDDSRGFIAGPLFHSSDPEGSTSGLFPVYWRWRDARTGASTHWLFPVAGWHQHPGARGAYVGPFYGWTSTNGAGGWGAGIAPIAFLGRSGTKHHAVIPPLFWRFSDDKDGSSSTAVGPVYYKKTPDGWDAGVAPLVLAGRHADRTYGVVPPIYWHFGQKNGATDVLGPLYFGHGDDGQGPWWRAGLAPLLFLGHSGAREHQVVAPIFFRFVDREARTERLAVGPLFFHGRDGDVTTDVFFPLLYLKRAPGTGLLLTPLAGWSKGAGKETLVVGPYIQQRNDRRHSTTRFLFPLGAVHDAPNYHVTVQFPFFWRVRDGAETDTVVFPFYGRVRSPSLQLDGVFPLALHWKTAAASTTIVGPIWSRTRSDGGRSFGFFPLVAYGRSVKNGKGSSWAAAPGLFYWDKNEHVGTSHFVLGPIFEASRPNGYTAGLVPLVFAWRRGTASFVVTPLFYQQHDTAADSSLSVLGPLYWGHNGATKKFGLFPILFVKTRPDGSSTTLFPLAYFQRKKEGSILATLLFGWSTYATGKRFYFGPLYVRRDQEVSSTAVWPLAYFSKNHVTGSSTKLLLPLYFDGRTDDGRELAAYTPLVWRYRSVERSVIIGLPGFFDVHSFNESRTSGFLPLFVRNHSMAEKSTSWTFPPLLLFARTRRAGNDPGTDVVWFPLVWRYGGKDSTTVVMPLFWDFKRGESRTTLAFPILTFYWKRIDAKRLVVLNMYYRRGINHEEGNWHCYVIPFVSFGRPRKQDLEWDVLMGLIGYARQGRNRTLKLFWLWDVPLEPVPASNLTWFGSTPTSARTEF
jgi:hypothetical protein